MPLDTHAFCAFLQDSMTDGVLGIDLEWKVCSLLDICQA